MYRRYTRVVGKAASYDLVSLELVKCELGIAVDDTSRDDALAREIVQVSAGVHGHCRRIFVAEDIVDTFRWEHHRGHNGHHAEPLELSRFPLANYLASPTTADTVSGAVLPVEDTSSAFDNTLVSGLNIPAGTRVLSHTDTTVTLGAAGVEQPITGLVPAGSLIAFGLEVKAGSSVLSPGRDYLVNPDAGMLDRVHGCGWWGEAISVRYSAGYVDDDIPSDLQMAVLRWITLRDKARGIDPSVKSLDLPGVVSVTRWVDPNAPGIPAEITDTLDRYRVPVVG